MAKIPITKDDFLKTVSKWISLAIGEEPDEVCGFCIAKRRTMEYIPCKGHCLVYHLCGKVDSPYARYESSHLDEERHQAALELLEGLYEIGLKLGYVKDVED